MSNQNTQNHPTATMIALYNFVAEDEPEISIKKGDEIEMLDMDPALNGWAYARKKRDGIEGYVPISYLGTSGNPNNNRSHKHSKASDPTRSTSPNPNMNKGRYDDKNNMNYNRNQNYSNYRNNNNQNSQHHGHQQQQQSNQHQNNQQNDSHPPQNNQNQGNQQNNKQQSNQNQQNDVPDAKQIICSFHRDFIPEMDDLYKYFGQFGKITNKLEIEYDSKKVPLAKIKFQSASCVDKVCDKGNRQQIPSGSQNGTIHIRVYRSMQSYINNTQRSNRGPYNKHKNSRRGGF